MISASASSGNVISFAQPTTRNIVAPQKAIRRTMRIRGAPKRIESPYCGAVGLNPHRRQRRSPYDYLFVGAAVLAGVALVIWAIYA